MEKVKSREPTVVKTADTKFYGDIFDVTLPVRFYFNKDGSFDGIEVYVADATESEQKLVIELCAMIHKSRSLKK